MSKLIKRSLYIVFIGAALLTAAMANAQELKVAYVDVQAVQAKAPQTAKAREELEKEFILKKKEIESIQSELEALNEKARRDGLTMSDTDKKELQEKLLVKDREFRWNKAVYEEDLKIRQNQITRRLNQEVYKAIVKIGQAEKYDLILSDGVLFASSRVNITEAVLGELKKADGK